jgi:hypothetical protein
MRYAICGSLQLRICFDFFLLPEMAKLRVNAFLSGDCQNCWGCEAIRNRS